MQKSKNISANRICFLFFLISLAFIFPQPKESFATASTSTNLDTAMCNVLKVMQGTLGKALAAFVIVFLGISLFLGKVSWGLAISSALGIGAIFGAGSIVNAIAGSSGDVCVGVS